MKDIRPPGVTHFIIMAIVFFQRVLFDYSVNAQIQLLLSYFLAFKFFCTASGDETFAEVE